MKRLKIALLPIFFLLILQISAVYAITDTQFPESVPTGVIPNHPDISSVEVQPIIIVPKDQSLVPTYPAAVNEADRKLQQWYANQLDGKVFQLRPVKVIYSKKTLKDFRCGGQGKDCPETEYTHVGGMAINEVRREKGIISQIWVVGAGGWAGTFPGEDVGTPVMGDWSLDAISGLFPNGPSGADCAVLGRTVCTKDGQTGAIGHELGHAINLDSWADHNNWHTLGPEGKFSIMANWWNFPNLSLLDTKLNPEKSYVLKRRVPAMSELTPHIERISPEEGEISQKLEIFGSHFGTASDKNLIIFGEQQLSAESLGPRGQSVKWSDDHITIWFPQSSGSLQISTKNGPSNVIRFKVKAKPPGTSRIAGKDTEISSAAWGWRYVYVNRAKTQISPTINGQPQNSSSVGENINIGVKIVGSDDQCLPDISSSSISLVWSGPNEDIPIRIPNLQNCQSYFVTSPSISGNYLLKAIFFGNEIYEQSESTAQLTVNKLPVKILTQMNGSANLTPAPDEDINIAARITHPETDECFADLDASRIYFSWIKPDGEEVPIATSPANCQPIDLDTLPDTPGQWKLKASFAGDSKHDAITTDENSMAVLNIPVSRSVNPQAAIQETIDSLTGKSDENKALENRIITEIKIDDQSVDPSNPGAVQVDLADHGCQIDNDCDYTVRIDVSYSVGDPDHFTLNLHYTPPSQGNNESCPNFRRIANHCVGNGVADIYEEDTCNPGQTRIIAAGMEDPNCTERVPSPAPTPFPQTACWIDADPDNRQASDEVCNQNHPDTTRCDQYDAGAYFDGCVP